MMAFADPVEDVLSACICSICLDVYKSPKHLPNCEHTLCLECVHQMVATHGATFACPECRSLTNLGPNGVEGLKSNVALQRAVEAITSPPTSKKQCIHLPATNDPILCEHCNMKFCESCLFRHMKDIKLAIVANSSSFERRITEATAGLGEKLSAAETKINDECKSAAEKVIESCRNLRKQIMASIEQSETRLLEKVRQFGNLQKSGLRKMYEDHQLSQEQDLMCQVEQLKKTPLVQCTLGSLVSLYHQVEHRNNEISKFEEFHSGTTLEEKILEIELDHEAVDAAIQNSLSQQFSSLEANFIHGLLYFTLDEIFAVELTRRPGKALGISMAELCGNARGVFITDIASGGIAKQDGRLHKGDQILYVNDQDLRGATKEEAAALFQTLHGTIVLTLARFKKTVKTVTPIPSSSPVPPSQPALVTKPSPAAVPTAPAREAEPFRGSVGSTGPSSQPAQLVEPSPTTPRATAPAAEAVELRRPEPKEISLVCGKEGLGFSIAGGFGGLPIYVQTVFPKGAAAHERSLKAGDELIAVNGTSLYGATYEQVIQIMKQATGQVTITFVS